MIDLEGFTSNDSYQNSIYLLYSNILNPNEKAELKKLQDEYGITLNLYEQLMNEYTENIKEYNERLYSNPYLNKLIQFTTPLRNYMFYVTNRGVAKYVPSNEILNSTNINRTNIVTLTSITWKDEYLRENVTIPTTPSLITGTPVVSGQQFSNEGEYVYVNTFIPDNTRPTYKGCYENNTNLTYIGDAPLPMVELTNGSFTYPVLSTNAHRLFRDDISSIPGWFFQNSMIVNSSTNFKFPIPYPMSYQCAALNPTNGSITAVIEFSSANDYVLSFYSSGLGKLSVYCGLFQEVGYVIYEMITPTLQWKNYSIPFTVRNANKQYVLRFENKGTDEIIGVQNISISIGKMPKKEFTVDQCMAAASVKGYQYFGVQDIDLVTSKGHCAVSNSLLDLKQNGASVISKMSLLWSSNTSSNGGHTCTFRNNQLQVLDRNGNAVYSAPSSPNTIPSYLMLQDSSGVSMGIYDNANNREVWKAMLLNTSTTPNPSLYSSSKYENKLRNGFTLAKGEFITSPNGNIILMMSSDGNLILITLLESRENCKLEGGGKNANAVYDIGLKSSPQEFGKLGYVTNNSEVVVYPKEEQIYNTTYTFLRNFDISGNDLSNHPYQTPETCKTKCNQVSDCDFFSFDVSSNRCYLKSKPLSYGNLLYYNPNRHLYFRNIGPKNNTSAKVTNINTVQFAGYQRAETAEDEFSESERELKRLEEKLERLIFKIDQFTSKFSRAMADISTQSSANRAQTSSYFTEIQSTNQAAKEQYEYRPNIQTMLNDSNTVVLQRNYEYVFWSALTAGSVLLAMRMMQ